MVLGDGFAFVHVPKTGGMSITEALGGRSKVSLHRPPFAVDLNGRRCFGFVRNPWDWMYSIYRSISRETGQDQANRRHLAAMGFKAWLTGEAFFLKDDLKLDGLHPMQRRSQMYWLGLCEMIGRFERIEDDFAEIVTALGIHAKPLQHLNAAAPDDYRAHYDNESVAFVAMHSAPEIHRFGYRFGATA